MRKVIDTHVHLTPKGQIGSRNEMFNVEHLPYGQIKLFNGMVVDSMPQYIEDSAFTDDTLVHLMERMNVEKAMILAGAPTNIEVTVAAVRKYPGKLYGAMTLKLDDNVEKQMADYHVRGLTAVKFEMSVLLGYLHPAMYPDFKFNSPIMKRVYKKAEELKITVVIDTNRIGSQSYQVEELEEITTEFSNTNFVFCHIGMPDPQMVEGDAKYQRWEQMMALLRKPNVWTDVCGLPTVYLDEEYPYPSVVKLVRTLMDRYGADKFIWATDIPCTLVYVTYMQMRNMFEKSPLFTEEEKDKLFYANAVKAFRM